ncbi:alpha/beta fold hydrolase [Variovorax sp. J22R133]|uniref:PHA/PHB synthase family protein n=1 Tax=Variovorax brevis TaxID=3053503 RepID=UPI00257588AA|nr:alpha/beta fold hydrolase [Variovorax sp. J22R133]MDM0110927.1 alpha/beta fold hydrolase [Variovorax sp. J22R133]
MATATPTETQVPDESWVARIQEEIGRAVQRSVKGMEYLRAPIATVGSTPKDVMLSRGTLSLYHYRPMVEEVYRIPLLLVMATTNKAYIFDLAPGQSLIEFLLKAGYDVYVMDWDAPRPDEKNLELKDYTLGFIPECVRRVQQNAGVEDVNIIGYCMGGVLSTIYAALHPEGPLRNLVCLTTPVDFRKLEMFQAWSDKRHFDVDKAADALGIVPARVIVSAFDALRPTGRVVSTLRLWDNIWNDEYVRQYRMMDRWGAETLPLAGAYFKETIKRLMWDNALYEGTLTVGGHPVDLGKITVPLLSIVAEHDHIVPYAAAHPLMDKVGSTDKEEVILKGGHVSLVAGPNAVKRMWPKVDQWLGVRSV